jgi:hypothetical protein
LVRGVVDDQSVPQPRPRQKNQFVVLGTWVTAPAARFATAIQVDDTTGFTIGMALQIMLDNGSNFQTAVASVVGNVLNLGSPMPGAVGGNYGDPIENMVLSLGYGGTVEFVLDLPGHDILDFNVIS